MATAGVLYGGTKTVTSAGTAEALATHKETTWVKIQALASNTGYIWVGNSDVKNDASGGGVFLTAGEAVSIEIDDLAKVYIDSNVNGEGVVYLAGK